MVVGRCIGIVHRFCKQLIAWALVVGLVYVDGKCRIGEDEIMDILLAVIVTIHVYLGAPISWVRCSLGTIFDWADYAISPVEYLVGLTK